MGGMTVRIEGLVELTKELQEDVKIIEKTKAVVRKNTSELQAKAKEKAQFRGHYRGNQFIKPTGNLHDNINHKITNGGLTGEVIPEAEYSAYVELGTRFMDSQPYLKPAFDEQVKEFKKDMENIKR